MAREEVSSGGTSPTNGRNPTGPEGQPTGASPFPPILVEQYAARQSLLEKALVELRAIVGRQVGRLGDRHLVRATLAEGQLKSLPSLWDKARRNGWQPEEAMAKADDLVGIRIVCNNLEDVPRVRDLILEAPELTLVADSVQDYLAVPKDSGYRAMHFLVTCMVAAEEGAATAEVKCEIQIRTYLADAWARLSHQDFYKEGAGIPPHLERLFRRLADLLKVTDEIAQDIREQVSRPRVPTSEAPTAGVSPDSLAFIYRRKFGEPPSEYLLQIVANRCRELGVTRSDGLDRKLSDDGFLDALRKAYGGKHGLELFDSILFEFVPAAVALGNKAAIDLARQRGREDWEEIDRYYWSELKGEWLRDTFEEFMESLASRDPRDPDSPADMVYALARAFDATASCVVCGATIVRTDSLAEAIAEHYDQPDKMDEIEPELFDSGVEIGYEGDTTYCNHCGYMLNKDD